MPHHSTKVLVILPLASDWTDGVDQCSVTAALVNAVVSIAAMVLQHFYGRSLRYQTEVKLSCFEAVFSVT